MRLLFTFLVLLPLALGCRSAETGDGSQEGHNRYATLKIYHTNDIHAHLLPDGQGRGGLAYLASVLKVVKDQEKSALILDAGDIYKKGSMPAQVSHDEVTADLVSMMPYYDARAVGNNEVKVGMTQLQEWAKTKEKAPLLSANLVDKQNKPVFQPSLFIKRDGLNIGIIGVTPLVPIEKDAQADPAKDTRAPYKILSPDEALPPLIKALRPQVDVLILLSHQPFRDNLRWAREHPEIDLIVSGHSHVLTSDQKILVGNLVFETGAFGRNLGVATLVYDRTDKRVSSIDSTFWPIGTDTQMPDPKMTEAIKEDYKKWAPDAF